MGDADLILLDEPFSALDPATRATMQELAFEHFAGRTVLLVTHDRRRPCGYVKAYGC